MAANPEWQLERYRPLLRLRVRQLQLDPRLKRRLGSSDLVQETLLHAHAKLADFHGTTEAELVRWLQKSLENVTKDEVRKALAGKRDVAREQSLQDVMAESSARLEEYLAADQSSPSQRADREEQLLRLAAAIDQLPEDYRDAVIQREILGLSVAAIAEQMGRTEKSVAGLLRQGRGKLRALLADPKETDHGA